MTIQKAQSKSTIRDITTGINATVELDASSKGALRTIVTSDNQGLQVYDMSVAVTLGLITGYKRVALFGYNLSVSSGFEPVWSKSDTYTFPSSASTLTISSTSTSDTLAGTGARKLVIEGLDSSHNEIIEQINMNGTSNVTTAQSFLRVNFAYLSEAGSNQSNAGDISINSGANTISFLKAGDSQSQQCIGTVPTGKYYLLSKGFFSYDKNNQSSVKIYIIANGVKRCIINVASAGEQTDYLTKYPFLLPPKTDIIVESSVSTGNPSATAGIEFLEVTI